MSTLTSVEQILAEGLDPVYIVFAMPEWEHFHPTDLPAPIADWIARNCPEVEVRRISNIPSPGAAIFGLDQHHDEVSSALEIAPVFMIGFSEEQAETFAAAWPKPDELSCDDSEFYFCDISKAEDPGVHQYDAHGFYFVPGLAVVSNDASGEVTVAELARQQEDAAETKATTD